MVRFTAYRVFDGILSSSDKSKVDGWISIIEREKAGPARQKALLELVKFVRSKTGVDVRNYKEALQAIDYEEPNTPKQ